MDGMLDVVAQTVRAAPTASAMFALLAAGLAAVLFIPVRARFRTPPAVGSWIPVLGCVVAMGRDPLGFLHRCHKRYGDVFTLKLPGRRMTFLMGPKDLATYFSDCEQISFQEAVEPFTFKVFGLPPSSFSKHHTRLLGIVRRALAKRELEPHLKVLRRCMMEEIATEWPHGKRANLFELLHRSMFFAGVRTLFGDSLFRLYDRERVLEEFEYLDKNFDAGSALPHILMPRFSRARQFLIAMFTRVLSETEHAERGVLMQAIAEEYPDREYVPNLCMASLWASQANAIPITFWTLAHILATAESPKPGKSLFERVRAECVSFEKELNEGGATLAYASIMQNLPLSAACVKETIRLESMGVMVRKAVKDVNMAGFRIPQGDYVCLSPYWQHTDERLYTRPREFDPERFLADPVSGMTQDARDEIVPADRRFAFVPFGSGTYRCPGQSYAMAEITALLSLILANVDFSGSTGDADALEVPPPDHFALVGVRRPNGDFCPRVSVGAK